jgi:hypothetical protein
MILKAVPVNYTGKMPVIFPNRLGAFTQGYLVSSEINNIIRVARQKSESHGFKLFLIVIFRIPLV